MNEATLLMLEHRRAWLAYQRRGIVQGLWVTAVGGAALFAEIIGLMVWMWPKT